MDLSETFSDNWRFGMWGLSIWATGVAALASGLTSLTRRHDRSRLVVLAPLSVRVVGTTSELGQEHPSIRSRAVCQLLAPQRCGLGIGGPQGDHRCRHGPAFEILNRLRAWSEAPGTRPGDAGASSSDVCHDMTEHVDARQ